MIDPRVASGLRDLGPAVMVPRERMLRAFRETFASFGFLPIETPHIERMEVLTGKGAGSDEVLRQIFEVTNKGGTPGELALRFDLTVPLARFIAKHVDELGVPFKRYAIGSVFRGERPAKGRFREFVQCDFDTVGTESPAADAETALVIHAALSAAGVPKFTIALNNRKILDGLLDTLGLAGRTGRVLRSLDKLAKVGRAKVLEELQRGVAVVFPPPGQGPTTVMPAELQWAKDPDLAASGEPTSHQHQAAQIADPVEGAALSADQAARVLDFVEEGRGGGEVLTTVETSLGSHPRAAEGIANLRSVLELLDASGVPESYRVLDLGLARGLDYYTGIVYETTVDGWERFGSISSGGRYDDLASLFTARRLPGVGASIGLDRLLALMEEAGWITGNAATAPVLVANFPKGDLATVFRLAARLRAAGIGAEVFPDPVPIGKQLGYGSNRGYRLGVIVGPDEQAKQVFNLRDLATRQEQKGIPWDELEPTLRRALEMPGATS
jgi:histidyl-tRNA synthetase